MTKWLSLNFYDINYEPVADMLLSCHRGSMLEDFRVIIELPFPDTEGQC